MLLEDHIKSLRYPGRFIAVGKVGDAILAVYGATGRSAASLARKYVMDERKDVWAVGASDVVKTEGNPELLEYQTIKWFENGFAIANGRQIETVRDPGLEQEGLMQVEPEPDKYLTPRITGVVSADGATLYMTRSVEGVVEHNRWPLELGHGVGYFISTYTGEDVRPTMSFAGEPVKLEMNFVTAKEAAKAVFDALEPPEGGIDYRVGVVGVLRKAIEGREVVIRNKL